MCGIFGFVGGPPALEVLAQVALGASTRGPHAFGFAWLNGGIHVFKEPGHLADNLPLLSLMLRAPAGIGQARLATSGEWWENANNQPLSTERAAIVHNGNVYNCRQIFEQRGWTPRTGSDSEGILCLADLSPNFYSLALEIVSHVDRRSPLAVMVLGTEHLLAVRRGHPLYAGEIGGVRYYCSRKVRPEMELLDDEREEVQLWANAS